MRVIKCNKSYKINYDRNKVRVKTRLEETKCFRKDILKFVPSSYLATQ